MPVITLISEAFPVCSECGEPAEMVSYHVDSGTVDPKCYACHTIAVVAAYQALEAARIESEGAEQHDNGTASGRTKRVRRGMQRRQPASDLDQREPTLLAMGESERGGNNTADEGTDDTVASLLAETSAVVGTVDGGGDDTGIGSLDQPSA